LTELRRIRQLIGLAQLNTKPCCQDDDGEHQGGLHIGL